MPDPMADQPGRDPSPPAYRAELLGSGCPHCGSGKKWKIVGPAIAESADYYTGWSDLNVQDEVDRLNRIFDAGVSHANSQHRLNRIFGANNGKPQDD